NSSPQFDGTATARKAAGPRRLEDSAQIQFSLAARRQPTSTLFPYTTLFRSHQSPQRPLVGECGRVDCDGLAGRVGFDRALADQRPVEDTSEFQPLRHVVYRLPRADSQRGRRAAVDAPRIEVVVVAAAAEHHL